MTLAPLSKLILSAAISAAVCSSASAASYKEGERWFEVEVILFNQLGDKSLLKEQFPNVENAIPMPKYRKVIDLLKPYLSPDIASLKQLLPNCDDIAYPKSFVEQNGTLPPLFTEKSLSEIAAINAEFSDTANEIPSSNDEALNIESVQLIGEQSISDELSNAQLASTQLSSTQLSGNELSANELARNELTNGEANGIEQANGLLEDEELSIPLTEEETRLVSEAESAFSKLQFNNYQALPKQSKQTLCQIVESSFDDYLAEYPEFSYNGIKTPVMPKLIDDVEDVYSDKPYLLNESSLQLQEIVLQLKRSKNFRPLLHMGWRHAPVGRNKAEAYRVYAGDNLALDYQEKLEKYKRNKEVAQQMQQQEQLALIAAQALNDDGIIHDPENNTENGTNTVATIDVLEGDSEQQEKLAFQATYAAAIEKIIARIESLDESNTDAVAAPHQPSTDINVFTVSEEEQILAEKLILPEEPMQPWFLDGLFRVHLNHYLYITADFNVMNKDLAEQATDKLNSGSGSDKRNELKLIRFQQNRRVISGEIHYFDHPYIGMVVQIRRHKRPEKEDLLETEAE